VVLILGHFGIRWAIPGEF